MLEKVKENRNDRRHNNQVEISLKGNNDNGMSSQVFYCVVHYK